MHRVLLNSTCALCWNIEGGSLKGVVKGFVKGGWEGGLEREFAKRLFHEMWIALCMHVCSSFAV